MRYVVYPGRARRIPGYGEILWALLEGWRTVDDRELRDRLKDIRIYGGPAPDELYELLSDSGALRPIPPGQTSLDEFAEGAQTPS